MFTIIFKTFGLKQVFGASGGKSGSRENNKSTWGHFTETVKGKLETVRGRRNSKEQSVREGRNDRSESGHYSDNSRGYNLNHDKLHTHPEPYDQNKETEMALEVFDTVLDSIHTDTVLSNIQSNISSGNGSGSGKSKKKRKERESFKNGGTWPRARGGPVIEQGTGTILHPHKQYKERKPLSELLTNVPKYPLQAGVYHGNLSKRRRM